MGQPSAGPLNKYETVATVMEILVHDAGHNIPIIGNKYLPIIGNLGILNLTTITKNDRASVLCMKQNTNSKKISP